MQQPTYNEQITMKNEIKLRELCVELPDFCKEFFRGIEPTTSSRTRIAYAYDLKIFFHFLQEKYPSIEEGSLKTWPDVYKRQTLGFSVGAVPGHTAWWLFPTFYVRELYGILYQVLSVSYTHLDYEYS